MNKSLLVLFFVYVRFDVNFRLIDFILICRRKVSYDNAFLIISSDLIRFVCIEVRVLSFISLIEFWFAVSFSLSKIISLHFCVLICNKFEFKTTRFSCLLLFTSIDFCFAWVIFICCERSFMFDLSYW